MGSMQPSRRQVLGTAVAGALLPSLGAAQAAPSRKKSLRIAHLTDIHVQPEKGAPQGMAKALEHALGQSDKPGLLLTGGDLIMDSFGASKERTKEQWAVFHSVLGKDPGVPVRHTVGNHDVWGWSQFEANKDDPMFGKAWACHELGLERPYYSFDQAGWHFIVLDSTFPKGGNSYAAKLDEEQFEWLVGDLASTPTETPVFVSSHIPIISICSMFDGENEKTGNWVIPGNWVHIDARRIKDLFRKHSNVKVCISGHEHLLDEVVYNGVHYFCNGAVSAAWWGGDYQEVTYGYTLIDLFEDGTFENRYVPYGWETMPAAYSTPSSASVSRSTSSRLL